MRPYETCRNQRATPCRHGQVRGLLSIAVHRAAVARAENRPTGAARKPRGMPFRPRVYPVQPRSVQPPHSLLPLSSLSPPSLLPLSSLSPPSVSPQGLADYRYSREQCCRVSCSRRRALRHAPTAASFPQAFNVDRGHPLQDASAAESAHKAPFNLLRGRRAEPSRASNSSFFVRTPASTASPARRAGRSSPLWLPLWLAPFARSVSLSTAAWPHPSSVFPPSRSSRNAVFLALFFPLFFPLSGANAELEA